MGLPVAAVCMPPQDLGNEHLLSPNRTRIRFAINNEMSGLEKLRDVALNSLQSKREDKLRALSAGLTEQLKVIDVAIASRRNLDLPPIAIEPCGSRSCNGCSIRSCLMLALGSVTAPIDFGGCLAVESARFGVKAPV